MIILNLAEKSQLKGPIAYYFPGGGGFQKSVVFQNRIPAPKYFQIQIIPPS